MRPGGWQRITIEYTGLIVVSFALFGVALAWGWRNRERVSPVVLFGFPVLFILALAMMYPPTAVDMFHYHADARTYWIFGDNPLVVPPQAHPYIVLMSWGDFPSPYGPFWSLLTFAPTLIAPDDFVVALVGFKLLAGVFYLGCAGLIWVLAGRLRPGWEPVAVLLYAWNPFIALRVLGNGHNDVVMLFFALLALERAERRDWLSAFPALALSVLVKFATALLAPMLLWYAWRHTSGSLRERLMALMPGALAAVLVTVLCYAPFWDGLDTFDTIQQQANNNKLIITSTALLLQTRLVPALSPDEAADTARTLTRLIFIGVYLPLVWQSGRDFRRLLSCSFNALFLYLIIASAWYRPWYMIWPVTLAAVAPGTWFTPLLVTIAFFGAFPDLVEQYREHWEWLADYWRATAAPVLLAFWPPLLVWYFGLLRWRSWHFDLCRARHEE
jgi:alpha-1,6-mannosyltransferase